MHKKKTAFTSSENLCRPANRSGKFCILYWLLMVLVLHGAAVAESYAIQHRNMLYLLSYFNNKHWRITGDTVRYDTAAAFTALTPKKAVVTGTGNTNFALFTASDNKLYLMKTTVTPPAPFDKYAISTGDPVQSPSGNATMITTLFPVTSANTDYVFLAVAASPSLIRIYRIATASFTVASVDSVSCAGGSASLAGLYGGPALVSGTAQSCLWGVGSAGSKGMVRYFSFNGTSWSQETSYDLADNETVTAFCKEAVGTQSGKIYVFQSNSFIYNSTPCSSPVTSITATGAVGNNGAIVRKKGSSWIGYTKGSANYTFFNFITRTDGIGVELLDDSFNYGIYTLSDTATFFTVKPDSIASYINNGYYQYNGMKPETLSIRLRDSDGNFKIPSILVNNTDNLLINGTQTLESIHPDTECVSGFSDLADTVVTLSYNASSINISAKSRKAVYNTTTSDYHWTYPLYQKTASWFKGSFVTISLGTRSLRIVNQNNTTGNTDGAIPPKKMSISIRKITDGISFQVPQNSISSIRIFNLHGQQIASAAVSEHQTGIVVKTSLASSSICVEYVFKNGSVLRKVYPLIH